MRIPRVQHRIRAWQWYKNFQRLSLVTLFSSTLAIVTLSFLRLPCDSRFPVLACFRVCIGLMFPTLNFAAWFNAIFVAAVNTFWFRSPKKSLENWILRFLWHCLQSKPLKAQATHLVMVESSFNRIFKDYQDFGGLEQIAYTVRWVAVGEVFITYFVRHLCYSCWTREKLHVPTNQRELVVSTIPRRQFDRGSLG